MAIKKHSVVTMHYKLKDAQGALLDSSSGQEPLVYLHGSNNIIAGLEEQLEGKKVGDNIMAVVAPEKGYGMPVDALLQEVSFDSFGAEQNKVAVGMRFQAETEQGPVPVVVTAIADGVVTVDGNHPLAGKELHFECSVSKIRKASDEEIEHGHVHGSGGHHH